MSRLYEIKVDEKRWKVVETDNKNYHSYKIVDKEQEEIYFLNHIIGMEQVTEDEFLVYRRANYDYFEIVRCKLQNSVVSRLFSKSFSKFNFISDDKIIFSSWGKTGPYRCNGIYSIKENKMLEDTKWLNEAAIEIYQDEDSDEKKLYAEKEIISYRLHNPKLLFTVNPDTLQPGQYCYSELRDSYIEVHNKEDIEALTEEEKKYVRIVEDELFQQELNQLHEAKEKLKIKNRKSK